MPVIETLKTLKTIVDITSFLESGNVAQILGDIEFEAAKKAFSEVPLASDKRGQIWVCIGHLNSCYEANKRVFRDLGSEWNPLSRILAKEFNREAAAIRIRFALCLTSICYAYLGEKVLCEKHFELIQEFNYSQLQEASALQVAGFFITSPAPLILAQYLLYSNSTNDPGILRAWVFSNEDASEVRTQIINSI
jgi:hypothetical protein